MEKLLCTVKSLTLLLVAFAVNALGSNVSHATFQERPGVPEFRPPEFPAYENDLIFGIFNPNYFGTTEVFRSVNQVDGFERVASIPGSDEHFLDRELKSNTTYYYKLRAELDGAYSEFSNVLPLTTGFKLYPPLLSAKVISSTAVEVTVYDVSYNDVSYDLWRDRGSDGELIHTISAPDSGEVFIIQDIGLLPSTEYTYRVDVHAQGSGNVFYPGMVTTNITTLQEETLEPPALTFHEPPTHFTCGNEIGLFYTNPNEGAVTEIYRSRDMETGFELVHTGEGSGSYVDQNLTSQKTYYYKSRAVDGEATSPYSSAISKQAGYAFFEPEIDVTLLPDQTIQIRIHDRSHLDHEYEIYGWNADAAKQTINTTFQLPDSAETFTIIDDHVITGETYTYHVNATLNCDGLPRVPEEFVSEPITVRDHLVAPSFSDQPPMEFYCESTIEFSYLNPNKGTQTEIYRSTNESTGYAQIATGSSGGGRYVDKSVRSNIVYYYKLRAVNEDMTSDFSAVWSMLSPSDFYNPELTAEKVDAGVELNLHDRSYGDLHYYIRRHEKGTDNWVELPLTISMPDSGSFYTYVDESAATTTAYRYYVDVVLSCDGNPDHDDVAYADVGTTEKPAVDGFTLVDPVTDMDVSAMYDGIEFDVDDRLNIRANTNELTQSVAFFINGQRYWGENQEPYALFGDRHADYNRGRFRPGTYIVKAVPYPENLHKGIAGKSTTIQFTVIDGRGSRAARSFAEVNVFPNPVVNQATIEVAGKPNARVAIDITDPYGTHLYTIEDALDDFGWLTRHWNAENVTSGVYYFVIKVDEDTHAKRIIIK